MDVLQNDAVTARGFALFDSPIGRCGIAWSDRGVAGLQLPEAREALTRARLLRRFLGVRETAPPTEIERALASIAALFRGEAASLDDVVLDMEGVPAFDQRVYEVARTIPPGSTLSYGEIAARLGEPGSARAVGQALGKNPFAIVVPCHRVLAAGGKMGGFSANGGIVTKRRLLSIEGALTSDQLPLFDGDGTFGFDPSAAVDQLRAVDSALGRLIESVGPLRLELKRAPSLFGALAEAIVYQQLHGRAAEAIYARLCGLYPRAHDGPTAEQILRTSDARLRSAGLSRAKALSLRDLAEKARDGQIPTLTEAHGMADGALVERLTEVRGIGRWTVEMLLIFRLGRPDVLPSDDYGIRKGFAIAFKTRDMPSRADVDRRGTRWTPYRTVASWYLWRAAERAAE